MAAALFFALVAIAINLLNSFDQIECNNLVPADFLRARGKSVNDQQGVLPEPDACGIMYIHFSPARKM